MAPFLERTDKQLDKWTKEQAKEEQGVFNSRTIIIIFFVLQIKKQMAVSCSGRSLARGGSTRQFPPPYPPTTTQPFSQFISNICLGYMYFTYVFSFHNFSNRELMKTENISKVHMRRCQIKVQFECGVKTKFLATSFQSMTFISDYQSIPRSHSFQNMYNTYMCKMHLKGEK